MSVPLRTAVAAGTATLAFTALAPAAHAEHRAPIRRDSLPLAVAQPLLRHLHTRIELLGARLALTQEAVERRRVALVGRWRGEAAKAVRFAYVQRGRPYVWGGTGRRGFDCSGLVQSSWRHAGIVIPRVAADQYRRIRHHVRRADLLPGDLVYFDGLGHVGIYIGRGRFIHAPHTGTYVQIARLRGYWRTRLVGAARPGWPHLPAIPTRLT